MELNEKERKNYSSNKLRVINNLPLRQVGNLSGTIKTMKKVISLYKPVGKTPLQCIRAFQSKFPEYKNVTLSYAGRLDPMAEGLLLILVGDENEKRSIYQDMDKTYDFTVLFGITTDSYDLLGIPTLRQASPLSKTENEKLKQYTSTLLGERVQEYPPFSSKTVDGKPLFYYARMGMLDEISLPSKKITIYSCTMQNFTTISTVKLLGHIESSIQLVDGMFRQQEIQNAWNNLLKDKEIKLSLCTFTLICSSGTYVRSLAKDMGESIGSGALAFSIKRTRIGDFLLRNSVDVF